MKLLILDGARNVEYFQDTVLHLQTRHTFSSICNSSSKLFFFKYMHRQEKYYYLPITGIVLDINIYHPFAMLLHKIGHCY